MNIQMLIADSIQICDDKKEVNKDARIDANDPRNVELIKELVND